MLDKVPEEAAEPTQTTENVPQDVIEDQMERFGDAVKATARMP